MPTVWSVICNRIDGARGVWKEWRNSIVTSSTGVAEAGAIPMLGPQGILDPSMLPAPANTVTLETNGSENPTQDVLNLVQGTNIVLTTDDSGDVTIAATGTLSTAFNNVDSGVNTTANLTIGTGASITPTGSGVINATEINGVPITGTLTHAGQIPISQPGNETAVWADPLVQGVQAVGTSASTVNPVLTGVVADGNIAIVNEPSSFFTVQATQSGATLIWTPASGRSFRLLKYQIEATANVAQQNQGVIIVSFTDNDTSMPFAHDVFVPSSAMNSNNIKYQSGWIALGGIGYLSVAANNVLNVNLSATLTAGNFRINVCGTEE